MNNKLITKKTLPPGGWIYEQEGASKPFAGMVSFSETANAILAFRKANKLKRATPVEVAEDLESFTCQRLPQLCSNFDGVKKKPTRQEEIRTQSLVVRAASRLKSVSEILADWLGEGGKPVDSSLSEGRAAICAACPYNKPYSNFSITSMAAKTIKSFMDAKNKLSLTTPHDEKLGNCEICGCDLALKVHVPIENVMAGTDDGLLQLFPDGVCWIRTERNA